MGLENIADRNALSYLSKLLENVNSEPSTTHEFFCCDVDKHPAIGKYTYRVAVAKSSIIIQAYQKLQLKSYDHETKIDDNSSDYESRLESTKGVIELENYLIKKSKVADEVKLSTLIIRHKKNLNKLAGLFDKNKIDIKLLDATLKMLHCCLQNSTSTTKNVTGLDLLRLYSPENITANFKGLSFDDALGFIDSLPPNIRNYVTETVFKSDPSTASEVLKKIPQDLKTKWGLH